MKWDTYTIESLCNKVTSGGTPLRSRAEFYEGGTIPWVKTKEVNFNRIYAADEKITEKALDNSSAKLIPENSILIAMYGDGKTAGRCAINRIPVTTNQACCNLVINSAKANPDFLFYKMSTLYETFKGLKVGGSQQNLNSKTLKEFEIEIPPLHTQRKIASILSAYDDLIENNLKRIKLLEEKAFLRYKGIVRSEKMEVFFIEDVCETLGGGTPSTGDGRFWDEGEILWFSPTDLTKHNSIVLLDSDKKITELGLQKSSAKLVPAKTILMTSRASIGYFGLINKPASTNQGFINIIPFNENHRAYMLFDLKSRKEEIIGNANGSTFLEISKGKFRQMKIKLPKDENALFDFEKEFEITFNLIENLLKQNAKLREARDILLPRLMSGKIEV
ncbi:MAG: restriction endonuclease subunit S [Ferruginibacter sp.]